MCITFLSRDSCRNLICKNLAYTYMQKLFPEPVLTTSHFGTHSPIPTPTEATNREILPIDSVVVKTVDCTLPGSITTNESVIASSRNRARAKDREEGGWDGGREEGRKEGMEGGRERGRERKIALITYINIY